jgi:hypothetical protein
VPRVLPCLPAAGKAGAAVTFAPTPRLEGIHELLGLPETQMRWRGVRGLELGNVGFWKSRPNSLVCQNIFVPKTWRGAGRGSRWGARAALAIRHFEFESSHPSHRVRSQGTEYDPCQEGERLREGDDRGHALGPWPMQCLLAWRTSTMSVPSSLRLLINPLDEAAHTMRPARPKLPSAGTKP